MNNQTRKTSLLSQNVTYIEEKMRSMIRRSQNHVSFDLGNERSQGVPLLMLPLQTAKVESFRTIKIRHKHKTAFALKGTALVHCWITHFRIDMH